jgi:hypothetical protein
MSFIFCQQQESSSPTTLNLYRLRVTGMDPAGFLNPRECARQRLLPCFCITCPDNAREVMPICVFPVHLAPNSPFHSLSLSLSTSYIPCAPQLPLSPLCELRERAQLPSHRIINTLRCELVHSLYVGAQVENIWVHPRVRGRGLGRFLLEQLDITRFVPLQSQF